MSYLKKGLSFYLLLDEFRFSMVSIWWIYSQMFLEIFFLLIHLRECCVMGKSFESTSELEQITHSPFKTKLCGIKWASVQASAHIPKSKSNLWVVLLTLSEHQLNMCLDSSLVLIHFGFVMNWVPSMGSFTE